MNEPNEPSEARVVRTAIRCVCLVLCILIVVGFARMSYRDHVRYTQGYEEKQSIGTVRSHWQKANGETNGDE